MKIKTFGWRHSQLDQLSRIEKGFIELGHEITNEDNPDFIYCHDSSQYYDAINFYTIECNSKPKLLLKVLDVPRHLLNDSFIVKRKENLSCADLILANSYIVQKDIKDYYGYNSHIVYDAMKEVSFDGINYKEIDFFLSGRLNDPNKRTFLFKEFINLPQNKHRQYVMVGPEDPKLGIGYLGIISDEILNQLYNRSKFVLAFGKIEGIALQIPEALTCHTPVICLSDNPTAFEFCPPEFICDPDVLSINKKINEIESNYDFYINIAQKYGKKYKIQFHYKTIAQNIINTYKTLENASI